MGRKRAKTKALAGNCGMCSAWGEFGTGMPREKMTPLSTTGTRKLPFNLQPPVCIMAPMVTQCDAPYRSLCRQHGCDVVYTEMLMADQFATEPSYRTAALGRSVGDGDHPLVVQFAANDPDVMLRAALEAQRMGADGVDLNLGHHSLWFPPP